MKKFIALPGGLVINRDAIAFIAPLGDISPGLRITFTGGVERDLKPEDARAFLDKLTSVNVTELRKKALADHDLHLEVLSNQAAIFQNHEAKSKRR
jgi:hypothetical protein